MKKIQHLASLFLLGTVLLSCGNETDEQQEINPPEPISFTKEGEVSLFKPDGSLIRTLDIEVADDDYERETGLMHRHSMEENQGMLFLFEDAAPRTFHMRNTHIPLDILFFGSDSTAVSFQENTKILDGTPLPSGEPAKFVLEINAGLVEDWNIEEGDRINFVLK